jgi:hypothetical protein
MFRVGRTQIQATYFVVVWRVGGVSFQVLPKIDYASASSSRISLQGAAIQTATRNLLHLLAYTNNLKLMPKTRPVSRINRRTGWNCSPDCLFSTWKQPRTFWCCAQENATGTGLEFESMTSGY